MTTLSDHHLPHANYVDPTLTAAVTTALYIGNTGDLSNTEAMLAGQAHDAKSIQHQQILTQLALRAQAAARTSIEALPEDALVIERHAEVMFARALSAVHAALRQGSPAAVQAELGRAEAIADGQPWLVAKLDHLRSLVARDREMASKEVSYSAKRMNSRLTASMPAAYSADETGSIEIPAFLRRKSGEGRGKKGA